MTRPLALFLALLLALLLCAKLTANIIPPPPDPEPITAEGVRSGVQFVADRIFALYPAPYRFHSGAEWQIRLCDIKRRADHIDQARLFIEVSRLLGMLKDAHSWAAIDDGSHLFSWAMPLRFWKFDDGIYIRAAAPEWARLVGTRVVAVGGVPIDEAWQRLTQDGGANESVATKAAQVFLEIPDYLRALGLAQSADAATLRLQFPGGKIEDVTVAAVPERNFSAVWYSSLGIATPVGWIVQSQAFDANWLRHRNDPWRFEYLRDTRSVVLQINAGSAGPLEGEPPKDAYSAFLDEAFAFVDTHYVDRLVIDLRNNGGGDESMALPLVHHVIRSDKINRPGRLYVLIGRITESASVAWSVKLERETMALFAGEPAATPPNFYNDPAGFNRETFHIAGSPVNFRIARQLEIHSSTRDDRDSILADLPAPLRYADYAAGRDTALEAVLHADPASARELFRTAEGEDVTDRTLLHYRRKSQDAARLCH
jgi:hypothetical protein